ncbi:MAG: DNA-binding protein [Anaerolineaceae bacterium]|nr:DNA-binding protein [Anaerolineaceae bacterium]
MITNERQYRITKSQLAKLQDAADNFDLQGTINKIGSELFAKAELDALNSEIENLSKQIKEYETLKSSSEVVFNVTSFNDLPRVLIQARISKNYSQKDLAELMGLKEQQIQRYEAEMYMSANLRRLIEVANVLGISISNLPDLKSQDKDNPDLINILTNWSKFPIKTMYKRGWFEDFTGSLNEALKHGGELISDFTHPVINKSFVSLNRMHIRSASKLDEYALFAWKCRVISLALTIKPKTKFESKNLNQQWLRELVQLSQFSDGPIKAKDKLLEIGIVLIIEPHLPNTYLDGAAFLFENMPIIGMTLRYDRIDNFWFVLLHELSHVKVHLQKGKLETIYDNLDSENVDKIEIQADQMASEALIPKDLWQNAIARFTKTEKAVRNFAKKLQISPAIVAGRIRYETQNFSILKDMVGFGELRNQFPESICDDC